MPKLSQEVIEEKKGHIEEAAKDLFIKQGFHGTSMRHIAGHAGVSLGNLYNYYRTKEEILESLIGKYQQIIGARISAMFDEIEEPLLPENLIKFGKLVQELVSEHYQYWLLMYIDVLEFQNRHCRKMFEGLAEKLSARFAKHFQELKESGDVYQDVDPAIGFTAAYLQFFNYFLIEKLFGGNHHFGINDDQAIAKLSEIFYRGILQPEAIERLCIVNSK
ncbi:MAG: TetR/AcrR family transcriptional regulator [Acidobacteriota bacterium]